MQDFCPEKGLVQHQLVQGHSNMEGARESSRGMLSSQSNVLPTTWFQQQRNFAEKVAKFPILHGTLE